MKTDLARFTVTSLSGLLVPLKGFDNLIIILRGMMRKAVARRRNFISKSVFSMRLGKRYIVKNGMARR